MLLCCDVGTLTSGVMLCYVCYVVTCHTAQRDTPRDRVSIVTLRQCSVITCHSQGCSMQSSASNIQAASRIIIVKFIIRIHYGAAADIYRATCSTSTQHCSGPAHATMTYITTALISTVSVNLVCCLWNCKSMTHQCTISITVIPSPAPCLPSP